MPKIEGTEPKHCSGSGKCVSHRGHINNSEVSVFISQGYMYYRCTLHIL